MKFSKPFKVACCLIISLLMTNVPALAFGSMISTSAVVDKLDRSQAQAKVQDYVNKSEVRKALIERGVSPDEVSSRLASLSEAELRQLSGEIEIAQAGGDILVTVLLIVLIIFLIKRI